MKKKIYFIFILFFLIPVLAGAKNIFKQLEKEFKKVIKVKDENKSDTTAQLLTSDTNISENTQNISNQDANNKSGNLLDIGRQFGVKDKTLDIINAGFGLIKSQQEITPEEENGIGGSLAIEVIDRYNGKYENDQIQRYVNLTGKNIARHCGQGDIEFKFLVLNSDEINAFAAPGGYVFITKGLYFMLENEAQLAGVLSHEIAHIIQKHIIKTLQRGKLLMNLTKITALAAKKDVNKYSELMASVNSTLFEKGVDKEFEYEADLIGIKYAADIGYNPYGLYKFLINLEKVSGKKKSIFFSTHPDIADRISKLANILSSNYSDAGQLLNNRFIKNQTKKKVYKNY